MAAGTEQLDEYALPAMNVTALGYEKSNLETPADVTVYSGEELKKTGASDVANALKYKAGVYFTQMGPHGQNWITNSSKATLRGVDNGTLVLINGVPASFNGVSHLDNINLDTVEKIEVVKGGGAVLYGSEAYGGVINIITKKVNNNSVYVAAGNNGQRKYSASVNADKLNIFAGHDELGATENLSVKEGSNSSVWGSSTKYLISFGKSKK
ncbi:TonB-dependent receptor, partial [Phascolarctobacterium succinatutens]|uniref:TonB-dependent receptor n=1 Tax=Phascolarctobacterium succinatutens TaxID=626940 RepID=UPI0026F2F38B